MEGDSGPQARQQGEASVVAGRPGACPSSDQGPTTLSPSGVFSRTQGSCLPSSPFPAKDAVPGPTAGVLFPKLWINESPAVPRGSVTTQPFPDSSSPGTALFILLGRVLRNEPHPQGPRSGPRASSGAVCGPLPLPLPMVQSAPGPASCGGVWVALAPYGRVCLLWVLRGGEGVDTLGWTSTHRPRCLFAEVPGPSVRVHLSSRASAFAFAWVGERPQPHVSSFGCSGHGSWRLVRDKR